MHLLQELTTMILSGTAPATNTLHPWRSRFPVESMKHAICRQEDTHFSSVLVVVCTPLWRPLILAAPLYVCDLRFSDTRKRSLILPFTTLHSMVTNWYLQATSVVSSAWIDTKSAFPISSLMKSKYTSCTESRSSFWTVLEVPLKTVALARWSLSLLSNYAIKDYRYHDFPNTEFSYFLTIDTRE